MSRPGTVVTQRDAASARGRVTDTGTWFVAGLSDRGPTEPVLLTSPAVAEKVIGAPVSYSVAPDAVEQFFAQGGRRVYFSRVVGPAAVTASVTLDDASAADAIKVEAIGPGDYANALNAAIEADGANRRLVISDADGELERSPLFSTNASLVLWASQSSAYVRVTALGAEVPAAVAATPLTGGTDDRTNVTDTDYADALDRIPADLGPGQVSVPGKVTGTTYADLIAHAKACNRRAILDVAQTDDTKAELKAAGATGRALADQEYGALFGPWAIVAGAVPGTTKEVPYSAIEAGLIAKAEADAKGNPNVAAAGDNGVTTSVLALKVDALPEADYEELNEAGVNMARTIDGQIKTYGFRTLADPLVKPLHWQLSAVRTDMAVAAKLGAIAERYVFKTIDGEGKTITEFGGKCSAALKALFALGALYGATEEEAFIVDVGSEVNTPETIAEGRLRAVASIRRSPFAELVEVEVVRVAVTDAV